MIIVGFSKNFFSWQWVANNQQSVWDDYHHWTELIVLRVFDCRSHFSCSCRLKWRGWMPCLVNVLVADMGTKPGFTKPRLLLNHEAEALTFREHKTESEAKTLTFRDHEAKVEAEAFAESRSWSRSLKFLKPWSWSQSQSFSLKSFSFVMLNPKPKQLCAHVWRPYLPGTQQYLQKLAGCHPYSKCSN